MPVLGIEPAANVAKVALAEGDPDAGRVLRRRDGASRCVPDSAADLLVGNNVLAHVPDLNDFVGGMKILLKPGGVITMEFPHLLQLIEQQPVRHHLPRALLVLLASAPSRAVFARPRAAPVRRRGAPDPRRLAADLRRRTTTKRTARDRTRRRAARASSAPPASTSSTTYADFGAAGDADKLDILELPDRAQARRPADRRLRRARQRATRSSTTAASAPTSSSTPCDLNPHKQGHFLPGTHIPIRSPDAIREDRPDVVLILPWNLKDEIMEQLGYIREWGGQFATLTPELRLIR